MRSARWGAPLLLLLGPGACAPMAGGRSASAPRTDERVELRYTIDSMLADPALRTARFGILIVDPSRGDTLYSHDAGKLFLPASNQKILTSAIALNVLGPEYRFRTTITTRGSVDDSTLYGNLLVEGRGDPSVSDHVAGDAMLPLQAIAEAVAARGITRVAGSILPSGDAFPGPNIGFGWPLDDLEYSYSAPTDELLFNEGFSEIHVTAGANPGDPVSVRTSPARTFPPVRVQASTVTRGAGEDSLPQLDAVKDTLLGDVVLSGTIPAGDSATLVVTHRDPRAAWIAALREALVERGIVVGDSAIAVDSMARGDTLFVLESPPLSQILGFFMKPSQNQIGEMLFKAIALQATDTGSERAARRLYAEKLAAWGAEPDGFLVWDGSGLSRRDMVTPETIVRVLDAMRRAGGPVFQAYYDAFPVAGVDGTLRTRMRGTAAEANLRGKTGTLGNVRSLSGYVTTAGGQLLLFSILCNNFVVPTSEISAIQDTIGARLARMRQVRGDSQRELAFPAGRGRR